MLNKSPTNQLTALVPSQYPQTSLPKTPKKPRGKGCRLRTPHLLSTHGAKVRNRIEACAFDEYLLAAGSPPGDLALVSRGIRAAGVGACARLDSLPTKWCERIVA